MISSSTIRRAVTATVRSAVKNSNSLRCASGLSSNFSTKPQEEEVLFMPPNLKIDIRTSASPFAGLEKVPDENSEEEVEGQEEEEPESEVDSTDIDSEIDQDFDDDDDDYSEGGFYSLANQPQPVYVIPLPERLNATILDFKTASEVGTIQLSEDVFGKDPIRTDILHRCVVYQRNKKRGRRNGGARTKTISEKSGSGKKMRNQKGGGVARAGHKRPAHWRGGAKAHGPKGSIQNYETKLNKKVRKMGLRMALSQKLKEGNLILVNSFGDVGTYKTKVIAQTLQDLAGIGGKDGTSGYLLDHVIDDFDEDDEEAEITSLEGCDINLKVGCQNILKTKVVNQRNANVYDLLKYEKLVLSLSALEQLEERYNEVY